MNLIMVGFSHQHAQLDARERLAFSPEQACEALERFRHDFPETEAVLLSTCNRMEFYTAADKGAELPSREALVGFLAKVRQVDFHQAFQELWARSGQEAVEHLFSVAAGLDSMVLGESQILGQVKQAYQWAVERSSAGPMTHSVFQSAVRVAKRVSTETAIQRNRVSIPSVAVVEFGQAVFERFDDKQILVIGSGEMAEETLVYLKEVGAQHVVVVNRNPERGEALANKFAGRFQPWSQLSDCLAQADVVVSTTGATEPVVTLAQYKRIEPAREQRPLFILDLAVPRDFEPSIRDRLGVYLYTLDDLKTVCARNQQERDREVPKARRIVQEETQRFLAEWQHRATGPIIQRLRKDWELIKEAEWNRLQNKLPQLKPEEQAEIRQSFDRLINKLLHPPLESLRDEAGKQSHHGLLEAFKRLFGLGD